MRLLRLRSLIWLCTVTPIVIMGNVPESSEDAVTKAEAGRSKRQFSAVADKIVPTAAVVFGVSLMQNFLKIVEDSPGL